MDTVKYSELVARFNKGLMRTAEGAEAAADMEIEGLERTSAIQAARNKLAEYNEIVATLASDSKTLEVQFAKKFAFSIDLIRESLSRIENNSSSGDDA